MNMYKHQLYSVKEIQVNTEVPCQHCQTYTKSECLGILRTLPHHLLITVLLSFINIPVVLFSSAKSSNQEYF
jgi:hypothetical protein